MESSLFKQNEANIPTWMNNSQKDESLHKFNIKKKKKHFEHFDKHYNQKKKIVSP